ncbi:MAG: AAA family ATPase [Roseibium sp.]|nr:AAA family ATPase [Roseibium sp.]
MASVALDRAAMLLDTYIRADVPVHLWGAPGIGKSDVVKQVANDHGAELVDIRLSMFDPVDLRGLPTTAGGETKWLRPAIWPTQQDRPVFLFFDELDRAAPAVQNAALQIILDRKIGEHVLPDTVRIVAAGNGATDRVGTNRTSSAGNNRFAHIDVEHDLDAWKAWALKTGLHPMIIAFLSFRPALLHDMSDRSAKSFPTPRAWAQVANFADSPDQIRLDLVTGLVGEGPAAEFEGFVKTFKSLPSLDGVIADPQGAPVPSDPGALFALAVGLSIKADHQTYGNVLTYARRMPNDFAALIAIDATRRDNGLYHTQAHTDFVRDNREVFQ